MGAAGAPTAHTEGTYIAHVDVRTAQHTVIAGSPQDQHALILIRDGARTIDLIDTTTHDLDVHLRHYMACGNGQVAVQVHGASPQEDHTDGAGKECAQTSGPSASFIATHENATALVRERGKRHWDGVNTLPSATVILCTTGSSDLLAAAVQSILDQRDVDVDLIVVDNAPHTGATLDALAAVNDPRLRIVAQTQPGLSWARNRGVLAARGEVLVFTDDDALADPTWLRAMIEPFAVDTAHRIGATTGTPLPLELTYRAQRWFESRGGFPKDMSPRLWWLGGEDPYLDAFAERGVGGPLFPLTTARVGAGVSMAFRAGALADIGPFDTALGAGTLTRGGEDLDIFARLLAGGWAIVHTPDAIVHHRHRRDEEGLTLQIRGNGSGTAALLTKTLLRHPHLAINLAARIPAVARRLAPGSARVSGATPDVPRSLTIAEIKGFLEGPLLYLRSVARLGRTLSHSRRRHR